MSCSSAVLQVDEWRSTDEPPFDKTEIKTLLQLEN